jgi:hypothetical protein
MGRSRIRRPSEGDEEYEPSQNKKAGERNKRKGPHDLGIGHWKVDTLAFAYNAK